MFAEGSLQGSVLVPILLGVLVATLFTEWFGWSFSGIVVPGYLTPIIIIAPFSAAVIGLEAVIVLLVARLLADQVPRLGWWAPLFGRDRFLLIFYLSVVVRLVLELGLLPGLEGLLQDSIPGVDLRNRFNGIGLVVVPLLANMMWKPGLLRGFGQACVTTALTWFLLSYVLVPFTNFNLGQFYLIYETIALDFEASPTAYIVLLIGAFLAAQLNLYLGWDFNGIMVPTLLAISLFQPATFVLTFVEAVGIYLITWLVMQLPHLRHISIDGPRLVAVMYSLGLLAKLVLEHADLHLGSLMGDPHTNAYGYLLGTLLAAKMWQRHETTRILMPTMQVAVLIALFGGFGVWSFNVLSELGWRSGGTGVLGGATSRPLVPADGDLMHQVNRELTRFLRPGGGQSVQPGPTGRRRQFTDLVRRCSAAASAGAADRVVLERLAGAAAGLGLELAELHDDSTGDHLLILRESPLLRQYRGWGLYAFRVGTEARLLVTTPRPVAQRGAAAAATALADLTRAHALLLPGAHHGTNSDGSSDILRWSPLPWRSAYQALPDCAVIDVRVQRDQADAAILWAERALPDDLALGGLEAWLGGLTVSLAPAPSPVPNHALRQRPRPAFASLVMDRRGMASLVGHRILRQEGLETGGLPRMHGLRAVHALSDALRDRAFLPTHRALGQQDLLFLEQQVVWPLLEAAEDFAAASASSDPVRAGERIRLAELLLGAAAQGAARIGYELRLVERDRGPRCALLVERPEHFRGRGTYLIRLGPGQQVHLLVPQPIGVPGALDAALALFDRLEARAISIGPQGIEDTGRRGRDRWLRFEQESLYQLVHQMIQRRAWDSRPVMAVELRGSSDHRHDILLREGRRIGGEIGLSPPARSLVGELRARRWSVHVLGPDPGDQDHGLGANRQLAYNDAYQAGPFVGLWLSRGLRAQLRFDRADDPQLRALRSMGLLAEPLPLQAALLERSRAAAVPVPHVLLREALAFARDRNLRRMEILAAESAAAAVPLALLQDRDSNAVVLVLGSGPDLVAVDLGAWNEEHVLLDAADPAGAIARFMDRRTRSLGPATAASIAEEER
ncbi:MAG: poly-gamma-glutamate biosynthesis protein PgsC/CapC [Planctomycetota bacterium]